jgi:hypothetical protein
VNDPTIAVLFACRDSIYKQIAGCDVWDEDRDATRWAGCTSIVAHPPCRAWGRLRSFANPSPGEKQLAVWAVEQVRKFGGVLEHPYKSTLWNHCQLPLPGTLDDIGGWTLAVPQYWMGHRADKATWFYIVGVKPGELPPIPFLMGEPLFVVQSRRRSNSKPHIPKAEREKTPLAAALWLVEVARSASHYTQEGR